ncbi:MAG: DUF4175 family protein [Elusimicrobia bacterium]|nr:DUF4175 family protein [Elusimicrobiota bacterium]
MIEGVLASLKPYYNRFVFCILIEEGLVLFSQMVCSLSILLLSAIFPWNIFFRKIILCFLPISILIFIYFFIKKFKKFSQIKNLCDTLAKKSSLFKDIFSAIELSSSPTPLGISPALKEAFISSVKTLLDKENPKNWIVPENFKKALRFFAFSSSLILGITFLLPRAGVSAWNLLFLGGEKEIFHVLHIAPLGGKALYGQPFNIGVKFLKESSANPQLYLKMADRWQEIKAEFKEGQFNFKILAVKEEILFKIKCGRLETGVYTILPVEEPRLTDFRLQFSYPSYLGLKDEISTGEPQVNVYPGTKVQISARPTKDLESIEMVTSQGMQFPVQILQDRVLTSFTVQQPFEFHFDLKDKEGFSPVQTVYYTCLVKKDLFPEVRLLSPVRDLLAGMESKIPFTFEFKDDLGVSSIFLKIKKGLVGQEEKVLMKKYDSPIAQKIDSFLFSLSSIKVNPKEVLKAQLEVQDNDLVQGPKSAFSQSITIEILDRQKEHEKIEKKLEKFRSDLLELLAEQTLARAADKEWEKVELNEPEYFQKLKKAEEKQSQAAAKTLNLENNLEEILELLENDPYSDYRSYLEHRSIKQELGALREGSMSQAQKKFNLKSWKEGVEEQDNAIQDLERLNTIAENVDRQNRMKDLIHSADHLLEKGNLLNSKLKESKVLDDSLKQLLRQTLKEAQNILSEIRQKIKDFPKQLPDEFVNKASVKSMNIENLSKELKELSDALAQGDLKSALSLAQKLLDLARQARDLLSKAAEETVANQDQLLDQEAEQKLKALDQVVRDQEKILQATNQLDLKQKALILERQRQLLLELAKRQKGVIEKCEVVRKEMEKRIFSNGLKEIFNSMLKGLIPKMENVLKELEGLNVIFSQKWLKEILDQLQANQEKFKSDPKSSQDLENINKDEEFILNQLKNPPKEDKTWRQEEYSQLKSLADEQDRLKREAKKLHQDFRKLGQGTATLPQNSLNAMKQAREDMEKSQNSLKQGESGSSLGHQQNALSHLRKVQEGLENSGQEMKQMQKQSESNPSNFIGLKGQKEGQRGFRSGAVRIPRADEYIPPREFREEILESLKEKYPKSEENIIKDYYKRIVQ